MFVILDEKENVKLQKQIQQTHDQMIAMSNLTIKKNDREQSSSPPKDPDGVKNRCSFKQLQENRHAHQFVYKPKYREDSFRYLHRNSI